jgi:hypothetical protein
MVPPFEAAHLTRGDAMTTHVARPAAPVVSQAIGRPALALTAALLGFFIVTLDAVIVNVALPTVQCDPGSGMVVFTTASLGCGLAPNLALLIVARADGRGGRPSGNAAAHAAPRLTTRRRTT